MDEGFPLILSSEEALKLKRLPRSNQSLLREIISCLTFFLPFSVMAFQTPLILLCFALIILFQSRVAAAYLCFLLLLMLLPRRVQIWEWWLKHNPAWSYWREYFSYTVIMDRACYDPDRMYIFPEWPHGVFSMGQMLQQVTHETLLPGMKAFKGATADVCLVFPIMRQLYGWIGCVSAGENSLVLEAQSGFNLGITPGGIAELYLCSTDEERIFFRSRKGYIRLAFKLGHDIVPVYHLGNTHIFDYFANETISNISRRLKFTFFVAYGRFFLPIPYKCQLLSLFGKPIPILQKDNPSDEDIVAVQRQIEEQVLSMFELYKHLVEGYENKKLVFV